MELLETRVHELEEKVTRLDTEYPFLKESLDQNTKSYQELNKTIVSFKDTMTTMNLQMATMNNNIQTQKNALDKVVGDVETLKNKVDNVDEKGKFDIFEFFKKYFPWIVVLIGIGVFAASNFIKF